MNSFCMLCKNKIENYIKNLTMTTDRKEKPFWNVYYELKYRFRRLLNILKVLFVCTYIYE